MFAMERGKIIVTFFLEGSVANGENFIEDENITLGANSNGKGEADLHAGGVIFEFLVHKIFEFGEFDDIIIHGGDFGVTEAKHGTIEIDVFATSELHVEADAKFDEGDEIAIDDDLTAAGVVDAGEDFEKGGFAGAVATNNADKFTFFDVEANVT